VVGSVGKSGSDLNLSVRLVDGNSGADLGSSSRASIRMPATDLLAARDSVIEVVAGLLQRRIGQEVRMLETRAETRSDAAWTLMQRGLRVRDNARNAEDTSAAVARLSEADSLFRLAVEADREWSAPVLQRGWVALERTRHERGRAAGPFFQSAIARADTVLASEPRNAKALELRGTARFRYYEAKLTDDDVAWRRLLAGAKEDLEASVAIQDNASTQLTLSVLYYHFSDLNSAVLAATRAYEADAYLERADDVLWRIFFGNLDQAAFGTAERWCLRGAARFPRDPRFVTCQLFLLVTPDFTADVQRGWGLVARLDTLEAPRLDATLFARAEGRVLMGGVLARAGLPDSARSVWLRTRQEAADQRADPGQYLPALEAYTRTLAGDLDEAIDLLKRAISANPDHDFANAQGQYWWWSKLREYPRWQEIKGGT
jgi:tetratricopeptide (TPR) repeat protein